METILLGYLGKLVLQFVSSIYSFSNARVESIVAAIESCPHFISTESKQRIDVTSQLLTGCSLTLRSSDVFLGEPNPRLWYRDAEIVKDIAIAKFFFHL